MDAPYSRGVIKFVNDIHRVGNGKLLLVALFFMLLASIVNNAAAMPYLNNLHNVPLFIQFFVIFMSIYHSAIFIQLKEIHKVSSSSIWDNLTSANFLGILLTIVTASLLYALHSVSNVGHLILVFAAVLDVVTHYFAIIVLYYLITPIIKKKIIIFVTLFFYFLCFFFDSALFHFKHSLYFKVSTLNAFHHSDFFYFVFYIHYYILFFCFAVHLKGLCRIRIRTQAFFNWWHWYDIIPSICQSYSLLYRQLSHPSNTTEFVL